MAEPGVPEVRLWEAASGERELQPQPRIHHGSWAPSQGWFQSGGSLDQCLGLISPPPGDPGLAHTLSARAPAGASWGRRSENFLGGGGFSSVNVDWDELGRFPWAAAVLLRLLRSSMIRQGHFSSIKIECFSWLLFDCIVNSNVLLCTPWSH